jgi:hypothetical protein
MRARSVRCPTGVFSPGPAAYSPRESLHRKVHQPTAPTYTMRPHLKNKVRSDGVTLSWAKGAQLWPGWSVVCIGFVSCVGSL